MRLPLLAFLLSFCFIYIGIILQAGSTETKQRIETANQSVSSSKEIVANLDQMKVYLVENGKTVETFKIVSVGRPGSFYETPTGEYKIETKERNHFSNLGKVHMPFSMQFFGNFFIHGIPYHPDGTRVSSFYSGGCIRMSDVDAEKIYNFAEVDNGANTKLSIIREQKYTASDYKDETLTKEANINIMTALISLESIDQSKNLKKFGNVKDALTTMLKSNDNNITLAMANSYGERGFVEKMNKKAAAIGLTDTVYSSVNYNDTENKITLADNIKLLKYIENNKSYIFNILENL